LNIQNDDNMSPSLLLMLVLAQSASAPSDGPIVSDNSFLVEEAYNQEAAVVQHINMFERDWRSGDWVYTLTQEWPVPHHARHQISYTLSGLDAGAGAGFGDMRQDDDPRVADLRVAGSAVLLPYRRANVLVEVVSVRERVEAGHWETTNTISPGVRWAHQAGAVQIVPGIGLPVTFQRDTRTEWGLIGYLSFEHPFERRQ
jgi:hypothetical protein